MNRKRNTGTYFLFLATCMLAAVLVRCSPASGQVIDFIGSAKNSLSALMEQPVSIDEKYNHYEAEGGSIDIEVYAADKIEKIVFSSIQIEATNVSEESVFIYPAAGYEFPVFWANMTRFSFITLFIFDFLPLQDLVMSPDYGQQYIQPFKTAKDTVMDDILKNTVRSEALELDTLAMYTYSPYKMVVMVSLLGALRVADVVEAFSSAYIELCNDSQELAEGAALEYATGKLSALRSLLKENDPGYPFMVEAFGETVTRDVMDIIF